MGAPTIIVLLQELLTNEQRTSIGDMCHLLAKRVRYAERGYSDDDIGSWELYNFNGPVNGITADDLTRIGVHVAVGGMREHDPLEEAPQLINAIGYYPKQCLVCDAYAKAEANHRLLGHVVLHLTELLHGYIDLNYAKFPTMHPENYDQQHFRENCLFTNDISPDTQEIIPWVYEGPGHIYEIGYNQATWYYNIVDCEYFRHYLQEDTVYLGN